MLPPLKILVGTMSGTAQLVADEVADALGAQGVAAEVVAMDGLDAGALAGAVVLICTSTYGQGDVPDNAKDLFAALEAARPDLKRLLYGVIALGDHTYAQTFCFGGKRFDKLLAELGARRVGEVLLHDASAGTIPEEVAVTWIGGWVDLLRAASAGAQPAGAPAA